MYVVKSHKKAIVDFLLELFLLFAYEEERELQFSFNFYDHGQQFLKSYRVGF
jgi:hypothetical protein